MSNILVTGGTGYIGSHTCLELLSQGHEVTILDNLSNSDPTCHITMENVSGKAIPFVKGDIRDEVLLRSIFIKNHFDAVIHFAGLKSVGESCQLPLMYYDNNISGTLNLLKVMTEQNCKNLIFSSSATVYGDAEMIPIREDASLSATNPYGRTKLFIEEILTDLYQSDRRWNIVLLRYFNPIGAHLSGELGENPKGIPNNLLPFVTQVAVGKLKEVKVFGDDYDTPDGTGVRDYIHVMDLAKGHVAALQNINKKLGFSIYNLGTGKGYSVLDVIREMESVIGRSIPYKIVKRRPGDVAASYADSTKAKLELGWEAKFGLKRMCQDAWRWQCNYPDGFEGHR